MSKSIVIGIFCLLAACGGKSPVAGASAVDRKAGLDSLEAAIGALAPGDFAANTQKLVQSIKALPQFADAGSSADGTVWGMFKGGAVVLVIPTPPPDDSATAPAPPQRRSASLTASTALTGGLPKTNRVHLYNGLGSYFSDNDPRQEILAMLQGNGYTGSIDDATLGNLRAVSGDAIFYIRTHGGMASDGLADIGYALWTSSEVLDPEAEAKDATLADDLAQRRVGYMLFRNDFWSDRFKSVEFLKARHYGITDKFVTHYMSFADDSLVYVDACNSADYGGDETFRDAFQSKNASVFVGWSERVKIGKGAATAKYVFDRLLGANQFAPESPAQRPFPYDALDRDPKFGTGKAYGYSTAVDSRGNPIEATLGFYPLGGQFSILAPGIYMLMPNEDQDELLIAGSFGPDPGADGKVTIGDVAVAIKDWSADGMLITTDLPRTGAGSSGNVVVTVRGHHSNARQLIAWDGAFRQTLHQTGSLTQRFETDVRLRLDPHEVRDEPGGPTYPTPIKAAGLNRDMTARFEATGSDTQPLGDCTVTTTWAGSGSIPAGTFSAQRSYMYSGSIDGQSGVATLLVSAADSQTGQATTTLACPPPTGTSTSETPLSVSTDFLAFVPTSAGGFELPLDAALNIAAGSLQTTDGARSLTLEWDAIPAQPAYDSTLPR